MTQNKMDDSVLKMFGLTRNQSLLLFSVEKLLTEVDIQNEKNEKERLIKRKWLTEWEKSITSFINDNVAKEDICDGLYSNDQLSDSFKTELECDNNTWYYILVLELIAFSAYTALGNEDDNKYAKCKYDDKQTYAFLKQYIAAQGVITEEKVDRIKQTYNKSLSKTSGKRKSIATRVAIVIALAAVAAALAAIGAGPISVLIAGGAFEGLSGAALVSACLALIGGGAIAAGGAGMAGGIAVIAGGGALLGLAGGGATVGLAAVFAKTSPDLALTQAAKLETVLKEVILNAQQDVVSAQQIIASYKQQIIELSKQLTEMELKLEKNEQEIKNIKASMEYYKKSCVEMTAFASSYELGMVVQGYENEKKSNN